MEEIAFAVLTLALAPNPIELPRDVYEVRSRRFAMPLGVTHPDRVERIWLFVSVNKGKTWKRQGVCKPTDEFVEFTAPCDGQFWFAAQGVLKDGSLKPSEPDGLTPLRKVFVNSGKKPIKYQEPCQERQHEMEKWWKRIVEIERSIEQSESDGKPK